MDGVGRGDGDGDDKFAGILLFEGGDGDAHGSAGRQAIVDEHDRSVVDAGRRLIAAVEALLAGKFAALALGDGVEQVVGDIEGFDHFGVEHAGVADGDGSHGEFFVARDAELANEHEVEAGAEAFGDDAGDGDAAAGQGEDEQIGLVHVLLEMVGEDVARLDAIGVDLNHGVTPNHS